MTLWKYAFAARLFFSFTFAWICIDFKGVEMKRRLRGRSEEDRSNDWGGKKTKTELEM